MELKFLKWRLPFVRRVLLRAFMLVLALIIVSLMQMARIRVIDPTVSDFDECPLNVDLNHTIVLNSESSFMFPVFGSSSTAFKLSEKLTKAVFEEMMGKKLLHSNDRALCVGVGSPAAVLALLDLGLIDAFSVEKHPFFSLLKRRFVYELNFDDGHFDFVYSGDLDRVSVPAVLVLEMERVLRPGGTGAILVGPRRFYSGGLVASFLKSSDVVRLCTVASFSLVIFKKRLDSSTSFVDFQLPVKCPSVDNNKPFMKYIEPLTVEQFEPQLSYLPNFMNITSRNKSVFINIGAGESAKSSFAKMPKLYRSTHRASMEVFLIDHKTSVLSSHVTNPSINFVYFPALGGETAAQTEISSEEHFSAPKHEEGFDFINWFSETVSDGDFVVLMMNAKAVELNILHEMFKTGAICHVDELFLGCKTTNCGNLYKSLRKRGVYVHQWFRD
ncbi:hypothetical protein ACS0TY_014644 [Phlomoides rotata]